jgi:hypothetical protein
MRWKVKPKETAEQRAYRWRQWSKVFCLWPRLIGDQRVWLEYAERRFPNAWWHGDSCYRWHGEKSKHDVEYRVLIAPPKPAKKKPEIKEDRAAKEFVERYSRFR